MNIFEKLLTARIELQESSLKKSGQNKFAGYDYFELADFMPKINKLMLEHKMIGVVSFGTELATLRIINSEKPEESIEFTSPMSTANLKGCHDVQNLGAVQTYLRRYLWVAAFEIVEHDALDGGAEPQKTPSSGQNKPASTNTQSAPQKAITGQPDGSGMGTEITELPPAQFTEKPISKAQLGKIIVLCGERSVDENLGKELIKEKYNKESLKDLSMKEASDFITYLSA